MCETLTTAYSVSVGLEYYFVCSNHGFSLRYHDGFKTKPPKAKKRKLNNPIIEVEQKEEKQEEKQEDQQEQPSLEGSVEGAANAPQPVVNMPSPSASIDSQANVE